MVYRIRFITCFIVAIVLNVGTWGTATAQAVLEEIVVTATKRAQNLQDVAGSIHAITSNDLDRNQIIGFDDYARQVPSLSALNQGGGQTQISMRGVFSARLNHAQPQSRSTIGLYLEDIPITTSAFNPDAGLADIERIEVLRGPQGTLYGASAMSGIIRIVPKSPNMDGIDGEIAATLSTTDGAEGSYLIRGMLNLPLSENFAVRGNLYSNTNGGFIDNVFTGETDYNDEVSFGGRLSALWTVSDTLSFSGTLLYHNLEADGRPDEYVPNSSRNSTGLNTGASIIAAPFETANQFDVTGERQIVRITPDPFDDEYYILGLTATKDFDWGELTSVSSNFDREFNNSLDDNHRARDALGAYQAGFYAPGAGANAELLSDFKNDSDVQQFTQEVRLSSTTDSDLRWVVGAFFMDQSREFGQSVVTPGLDNLLDFFGIGAAQGFAWGGLTNSIFTGSQSIDTQQIAVFGEITWALGDQLELTLGARVFEYDQEADIFFAGIANDGVTLLNAKTSESGVNPNVVLQYTASDDINYYASASKGFRIGGLNDPIPLSGVFGTDCAADLQMLGLSQLQESFESDELWNYEFGIKSTLAGGSVQLNAAVFFIDWEDVQTQAFLPCGFQTLTNDVDIESKGAEIELIAQPTESLGLHMGASYTDSSLNGASIILAASDGDAAPYTPEWQISAGFDYAFPGEFISGTEFYLRGDIQYTSESFSEFSDTFVLPRVELPSHTSVNVYLGLATDDSWELALFIKNLTNERIVTGFDADRRQPPTFSIARPRTIGVNAKYRF